MIHLICPAGTWFRPPAKFGTPVRRAARRGRLWGFAPSAAPLASPPEHPLRGFSTFAKRRGHASCAAGASLTRCTRSGDLPPRRVNARVRFRSGQNPLQPNTAENLMVKKYSLTFPTIPQTFCSSTLVSEQFTRHSKYRPFAFSAACHKAYPMLVFIAFQYLSSKAGREVTFLILARAQRGRWLVLREFAKYAFLWPDKAKSCF